MTQPRATARLIKERPIILILADQGPVLEVQKMGQNLNANITAVTFSNKLVLVVYSKSIINTE